MDVDDEGRQNEDQDDEEQEEALRHPRGKTLPYRIKSQLESAGVNASTLRENGLGLFQLSALSTLMRMYNLVHDAPPDVSTEISADAVQFLHAHVVRYVTELIHRAIVFREQERDMKASTKVWRFNSNQIIPATIQHAMEMLGTSSLTKKSVLARVVDRLKVPLEDAEEESQNVPSDDSEDDDQDQMETTTTSTVSLHHGMYAPLVRLPPALGSSNALNVYEGYRRKSAPISVEPEEDPLLPSGSNKKALATELGQEEELDAEDRIAAEQQENVLWGEYRRQRTVVMVDDEDFGNDNVKSQQYVVDSE